MARRWKEPAEPKWLHSARNRLAAGNQSDKRDRVLLQKCVNGYERLRASVRYISRFATTEEGDRKATEAHFGLAVWEVIQMAHDEMIETAREALKR